MAQTITISTRAEWGKYLRQQASEMMMLQSERDELRKLVIEAYDLHARMPERLGEKSQNCPLSYQRIRPYGLGSQTQRAGRQHQERDNHQTYEPCPAPPLVRRHDADEA